MLEIYTKFYRSIRLGEIQVEKGWMAQEKLLGGGDAQLWP